MLNYFKMVDIGIRLGQHFTRNLVGAANELREDEKILSLMHEKLQKEIEAIYLRAQSRPPLVQIVSDLQMFVKELAEFGNALLNVRIKRDIQELVIKINNFISEYPRIYKELYGKTDTILLGFMTSMIKYLKETLFKDFDKEMVELERIRRKLVKVVY